MRLSSANARWGRDVISSQPAEPADREGVPPSRARSRAPSRKAALQALSQIANAELSPDYIADFFLEVAGIANHRGAAILLATHLEAVLQLAIIARLSIRPNSLADVFGYDRPMGNFANKIRIAHAIGLITDATRSNLDIIRQIRNAFAHAMRPISFETKQVAEACALLVIAAPLPPTSSAEQIPEKPPARQQYRGACETISHNLFVASGFYYALTQVQPPSSV
jgi:hypothetical protein